MRDQQHNQDLRRIYYVEVGTKSRIHHFYQNALHLTSVHCASFYQGMSQCRTLFVFRVDSSEPSKPIQRPYRILF